MLPKSTTTRTWWMPLAIVVAVLLMPFGFALASSSAPLVPPPGDVTATYEGNQQVKLSWTDRSVTERVFGIRYKVKGEEWTPLKSVPSNTRTDAGKTYTTTHDVPSPGVTYCYQVTAASLEGVGISKESCAGDGQRQLVPSYMSPRPGSNLWPRLCQAMDREDEGSIAVLNIDSGPIVGAPADEHYAIAVELCRDMGHEVIGYISTQRGDRSKDVVMDEIDEYYSKYTVDGIFFDEMATKKVDLNDPATPDDDRDNVAYYKDLYNHVHSKGPGAIVVGNPGAAADDDWQLSTPVADIVVVIEDTAAKYLVWDPPEWAKKKENSDRLSHMVHKTPASQRAAVCKKSQTTNAGFIYVTDDFVEVEDPTDDDEEDPNQWNELPTYWDQVAPVCKGE